MLTECGFVRAVDGEGQEWTFTPSLRNIAALGDPHEIVRLYAGLHGPDAEKEAAYVLAGLCDQDDPTPLLGTWQPTEAGLSRVPGSMPGPEMVLIARHLMQHGIIGTAKPSTGDGKFSDRFDAAEYVSAARVHLGLSSQDAEALSMTEFQQMFAMKFPESGEKKRDVPSREEYEAAMARVDEMKGKRHGR